MHLKELVIDPSISHCGIGDQRYGMHFVTVDAEEPFSMRDPARRLLPVAQLQNAHLLDRENPHTV
jgi:hypothetical protein